MKEKKILTKEDWSKIAKYQKLSLGFIHREFRTKFVDWFKIAKYQINIK